MQYIGRIFGSHQFYRKYHDPFLIKKRYRLKAIENVKRSFERTSKVALDALFCYILFVIETPA
jgi:hypothetical protein